MYCSYDYITTCDGGNITAKPYMNIRGTDVEFAKLQRAWTKSGEFANRSQFIKAAVNAYAGEKIFD